MSIDPRTIRREGSALRGRYVHPFDDGSEAELTFFQSAPGVVTIDHTLTPVRHRGKGVAAELVTCAVADFRADGRKVIPVCWFAREQFDAHPEWADLLFR